MLYVTKSRYTYQYKDVTFKTGDMIAFVLREDGRISAATINVTLFLRSAKKRGFVNRRRKLLMAMYDKHFNGYRVFVGDLGRHTTRYDVEKEFEPYGELLDVWVARNPPGFAFLVFKNAEECERAVRKCHGRKVCGRRVRVEFARPFDDRGGDPKESSKYRSRSRSRSRQRSKSRSRSPVRSLPRNRLHRTRRTRSRSTSRDNSRTCSRERFVTRSRSRGIDKSISPSREQIKTSSHHSSSNNDQDEDA